MYTNPPIKNRERNSSSNDVFVKRAMLPRGLSPEKTQETGGNRTNDESKHGRENNKELISRVPQIRFAFLMKRREKLPTDMTAHTCDDDDDDTKTYGMARIRQILNDPIKYRIEHAPLAATRVVDSIPSDLFLPLAFFQARRADSHQNINNWRGTVPRFCAQFSLLHCL